MKDALVLPGIDLTALVDAVAERIVSRLHGAMAPTQGKGDGPLLLTVAQAARRLGRSLAATEHLIRAGKLKSVKIDRRVFVDDRDILALIEQSKNSA